MPLITDLEGLWRRSLIAYPDGRRDVTTRVHWLQGMRSFVDLRQPASLPLYGHVRSLDDLDMADLTVLASQQGFAGTLDFDGRYYEWCRRIDYQPTTGVADAGSLEWQDEVLVERGRDVDYVEHWHRDADPSRTPLGAAILHDHEHGTQTILVRVGKDFMLARDRTVTLSLGVTLMQFVTGATLYSARRAVDCEISRGTVEDQGFRILASTLPFKCGTVLKPRMLRCQLLIAEQKTGHAPVTRTWDIAEIEGDADALLHISL